MTILKALECYEKSLKIRLSVYGENDEIVANDYERMGQIYFAQDDCSKNFWNIMKKSFEYLFDDLR